LASSRKFSEDFEYDFDPKNQDEISKLVPFGQFLCSKISGAFGEYKNIELPEVSYDYFDKL